MHPIDYVHVDVFTNKKLQGNGLAVVFHDGFFSDEMMLELTREFKQFETIFLSGFDGNRIHARIFTMEGELPFAGHPILGGAAALHDRYRQENTEMPILFQLEDKTVPVLSLRTEKGFHVQMEQGRPSFMGEIPLDEVPWLAKAHGLSESMLHSALPMEVVSTGLPYVLIPVCGGLQEARVSVRDLEARIGTYGACYTYLFNPDTLEARTWDNLGLVEDSATGSAAGPVAAYLVRHGRLREGVKITIRQGQYAHRPGVLVAWVQDGIVYVSGDVAMFAKGQFYMGE